MALLAKITKAQLAELPEALRGEYKDDGDGENFTLDVTPVGDFLLKDVGALHRDLSAERDALREAKGALTEYQGLFATAAEAKRAKELAAKAADGGKGGEKAQEQLDALRQELQAKAERDLSSEREKTAAVTQRLHQRLLETEAVQAITKHKGSVTLLKPLVLGQLKVVEQTNPDGSVSEVTRVVDPASGHEVVSRRPGSTGPMSADELVETMKGSGDPDLLRAFDGAGKSGGGPRDGGGGGPARNSLTSIADPTERMVAYREQGGGDQV